MYTLTLTDGELKSLAWVADRYISAQVLYDSLTCNDTCERDMCPCDCKETTYNLQEHEVWDYMEALKEEDGNQLVPPCIGGTLSEKLINLYQSIV